MGVARLTWLASLRSFDGSTESHPTLLLRQIHCLEGLTRNSVALRCHCAPTLVTLRLQTIEKKLGRKASELRQLSGHFERIAESLTDERARRVHRAGVLDQPEESEFD